MYAKRFIFNIASMSLLPQLSSYTGMLLVGLFIPVLLKRKRQMALYYETELSTEREEDDRSDLFKRLVTIACIMHSFNTLLIHHFSLF